MIALVVLCGIAPSNSETVRVVVARLVKEKKKKLRNNRLKYTCKGTVAAK
jgi:hypothetical protein